MIPTTQAAPVEHKSDLNSRFCVLSYGRGLFCEVL